ncbi:unnamed protein product [Brassicogethes aeneus]|uniref:C2H2-type domain-containing protein n=1 Tax=Brassicogethes aeneus TaxID=1431903 RepID=A0A9P0ATN9_BRAAE|nr:unnamed protein product [Brassicogethes aeneus]
MEQIDVKKEPKELINNFKADISTNCDKPSTYADQEMPSTFKLAIKQEIKEEFDDNDNSIVYNKLGVKKELKMSTDEEDNLNEPKQAKDKMFLDKGYIVTLPQRYLNIPAQYFGSKITNSDEESNHSDDGDESEDLPCNVKEEGRDFCEGDKNSSHNEEKDEDEENIEGVEYGDVSGKEMFFKCDICPKKYQKKKDLFEHKKYLHRTGELDKLKCHKCDFETLYKSSFKSHLNIHDKKTYLKCHFCHYTTAKLHTLNAHMLSKHNSEENIIKITSKIHSCTKCTYSTVKKSSYDSHIKVCLKLQNVKWYECHFCLYRTINKSHLNRHVKTHNEVKDLNCLFCQYKSNIKQHLDNHLLTNHSHLLNESNQNLITSKLYVCKHCNYKTITKYHLKRHVKNNH